MKTIQATTQRTTTRIIALLVLAMACTACPAFPYESYHSNGRVPTLYSGWDALFGPSWDESSWELLEGEFHTVETFHAGSTAISVVGEHVRAIHTRPEIPHEDLYGSEGVSKNCMSISYLAKLTPRTTLTLGVDTDGDQEIDETIKLKNSNWEHHQIIWSHPNILSATRFELEKIGAGDAIFEHLVFGICNRWDVLDCAGTAGGDAQLDACGVCDQNPYNDCE
jgi:hypothetical protein